MERTKGRSDPEWRENPSPGRKRRKKDSSNQEEDLPRWEKIENPQVILTDQEKESALETKTLGSHQTLGREEEKNPG